MNIRVLVYGALASLAALSGCIISSGHGGYEQGRHDERHAEAERDRQKAHDEAREERRDEERREERLDRYCEDPDHREHDERCR